MSTGLARMTQTLSVPRANGVDIDILDELGITHAQNLFTQRTLALTAPQVYHDNRNAKFKELTDSVKGVYAKTIASLNNSGLPSVQIHQLAINAAASTYATENAILEASFPSGSTAVAMQSAANTSFKGMLDTPAISRRAPRRAPRRSTKKKK